VPQLIAGSGYGVDCLLTPAKCCARIRATLDGFVERPSHYGVIPMNDVRSLRFAAVFGATTALPLVLPGLGWAQEAPAPAVDTGDTAWVLMSAALVMLMTAPGLALFYGGLVRTKNVLGTIMQSVMILCTVTLLWILFGYSLTFGPDVGGFIGGLDWVGLRNVGLDPHPTYGPTIPHQVFMMFQLMFAAITPALITGAFAERMRFSAVLMFTVLWSVLIYFPLAHWVWGGGWLAKLGAVDFAGGAVIHISSGASALACALMLGVRKGYGSANMAPHNLPMALLGTGLLWFGWFGFNAGSGLGANSTAVVAFTATHIAAAAGAISWMAAEWAQRGKPTVLGVASGVIAGLATVTPGAGYVGPFSALLIGLVAGAGCYFAVVAKARLGYDDSLDVVGIHGVGGIIGILATGLVASVGVQGLFFGNPGQLGVQALLAVVSAVFAFVGSIVILKIVDAVTGLRVTVEDEQKGLDLSQHEERAYSNE
jgi:Amt family ammonium transporter